MGTAANLQIEDEGAAPPPSFIGDYLRAGYTVERVGTFYSVFDLLFAVREIEDAGGKVCIKLYRDKTGRPDGIELARLVEKKDTQTLALFPAAETVRVPVLCPGKCGVTLEPGETGYCYRCTKDGAGVKLIDTIPCAGGCGLPFGVDENFNIIGPDGPVSMESGELVYCGLCGRRGKV